MKAAREYLPSLEPRHPPKSDSTIFGKPIAEVAALLPNGGGVLGNGGFLGIGGVGSGGGSGNGGAATPATAVYMPGSLRSGKVSLEHVRSMMEGQMERHNQVRLGAGT